MKPFSSPMFTCRFTCSVGLLCMSLFLLHCSEEPHMGPGQEDQEHEMDEVGVRVEAEKFMTSSREVELETLDDSINVIHPPNGKTWMTYEVPVPVAGRYRVEVKVSSDNANPGIIWLEDYHDNTDNRSYDITSSMAITETASPVEFDTIFKDGSPLDSGMHPIKLHVEGNDVRVDWIQFTLLRKHQPSPTILTQSTEGTEWVLKWSDEFEGSGLPDTSKWTYDLGNWGWGNREPQYYTEFREENARLEAGNLIIEAHKDDMGYAWTSARLTTRGKVGFTYGKIEFRAKVPVEDGTWPAGWTIGDAFVDEKSWPYCGEIDVLEVAGREIDDVTGDGYNHAACHTRAFYHKQNNSINASTPVKNMRDEFHLYTVEWLPTGVKAYMDGQHYYTYDKLNGPLEWPFDEPQNIIVNVAMGGGFGGKIADNFTSAKLVVDYIRVYELK